MNPLRAVFSPRKEKDKKLVAYSGKPCTERIVVGQLEDFLQFKTLGTGTFGRVKLAQYVGADERFKQNYFAIKIMKKRVLAKQKQAAHIKSEISLLASLSHPFIVNLVNNFDDDKKIYLVLEFVAGGELFSLFKFQEKLSNEEAKFYCAQITCTFIYLHERRIAYRDLKPENVLITNTGYIKLTDFGFAKVITDRAWTLCGTPEYLAPEIVTGKGHSVGVDWWALGVFAYELLVGQPPFYDESHIGIYQQILSGKIELFNFLEPEAMHLMTRLLQQDLSKRLGCMKGGPEEVKKATWFGNINFDELLNFKVTAYYIPPLSGLGDTSNFEVYPESVDEDYSSVQIFTNEETPQQQQEATLEEEKEIKEMFSNLGTIGFATLNKTLLETPAEVFASPNLNKVQQVSVNANESQIKNTITQLS